MRKCSRPRWVELRTANGKLACRYDPRRRLIEHVHRGEKTLFDLAEMDIEHTDEQAVNRNEIVDKSYN